MTTEVKSMRREYREHRCNGDWRRLKMVGKRTTVVYWCRVCGAVEEVREGASE